jgi:predicted oxidoreductase
MQEHFPRKVAVNRLKWPPFAFASFAAKSLLLHITRGLPHHPPDLRRNHPAGSYLRPRMCIGHEGHRHNIASANIIYNYLKYGKELTMKNIKVANSDLNVSEISLGCMRISSLSHQDISTLVHTALDEGINFFDHADVYGDGQSEAGFAEAIGMNSALRQKMFLQTKCGIRKGICFDFSKEHILASVDGSLKRLRSDYIDALLLHRPDALVEPEEVAEAFSILQSSGKVQYFGVSNQKPMQIELLSKYLSQKILFNQLQFSITNSCMIDSGINVNMENDASIDHDGSILDYCRLKEITIQPWSPFQYGFFEGVFLDNDKFPELNAAINDIAAEHHVNNTAIAIAWILRHPARMQPIVGTTNPTRLKEICKASGVNLSREEWYRIYLASGKRLP